MSDCPPYPDRGRPPHNSFLSFLRTCLLAISGADSASAPCAPGSAAFFHRTCFVNYQRPAHELLAIACLYGMLYIRIFHFSETKSSGFIREPVSHYTHSASRNTLLLEPRRQIRFGCPIGEIANI